MSCTCGCSGTCDLRACVAEANAINGSVGVWPYRLFLVRRSWDGGEPGRGEQTETRTELGCNSYGKDQSDPDVCIGPPNVRFATSTRRGPEGTTATDTVTVDAIDGRLKEIDIAPIEERPIADELLYEIIDARTFEDTGRAVTRCTVIGRPVRSEDGMTWTVKLRIQQPGKAWGGAAA